MFYSSTNLVVDNGVLNWNVNGGMPSVCQWLGSLAGMDAFKKRRRNNLVVYRTIPRLWSLELLLFLDFLLIVSYIKNIVRMRSYFVCLVGWTADESGYGKDTSIKGKLITFVNAIRTVTRGAANLNAWFIIIYSMLF